MDEQAFKRHLRDLAHGHHHPEEHDWGGTSSSGTAKTASRKGGAKRSQPRKHTPKKGRPR